MSASRGRRVSKHNSKRLRLMSNRPSVTRVVKYIRKGESGNSVIVADTTSRHYTYAQWQTYGAKGHLETWGSINNADKFKIGDTIVINGVCSDRGDISVSLYATVGAVNVESKSVTATTTSLIMGGEDGSDGEDAISIVITGDNVVFTKTSQFLYVSVEVFKGNSRLPYGSNDGFYCGVLSTSGHYLLNNNVYWSFQTEDNGYRFCYMLGLMNKVSLDDRIPFTVTVQGAQYSRELHISTVFDGEKGDRGPALRGPQDWDKLPVGYSFQSGQDGDEWKDVVVYQGSYASCIKNHTKTSDNYPTSTSDSANGYWAATNKWEIVATNLLLTTYALVKNLGVENIEMKDASGNIIFLAKDGNVTCNTGTFNNINVQSGKIAGFTISGNGLTNEPFNNDAYVIFRNDLHSCFAGIGGNVLPAASGMRSVARFENEDTSDWWALGRNIALYLSAKNSAYNNAFIGHGHGSLDGFIVGYRLNKMRAPGEGAVIKYNSGNYVFVENYNDGASVILPSLAEIRATLGIGNSTTFALPLTICGHISTKSFKVVGRNGVTGESINWPKLRNKSTTDIASINMAGGDFMSLMLIYDGGEYYAYVSSFVS